ncbi:hypothetical protein C6P86_18035 [Burkholderia multivorans]|nr:hypothetical protein C6P86_18035 [Burkholderia multivorans]PRE77984.1 hypothetical protein C6Q00_26015 [Burkholderia multivorans]
MKRLPPWKIGGFKKLLMKFVILPYDRWAETPQSLFASIDMFVESVEQGFVGAQELLAISHISPKRDFDFHSAQ